MKLHAFIVAMTIASGANSHASAPQSSETLMAWEWCRAKAVELARENAQAPVGVQKSQLQFFRFTSIAAFDPNEAGYLTGFTAKAELRYTTKRNGQNLTLSLETPIRLKIGSDAECEAD